MKVSNTKVNFIDDDGIKYIFEIQKVGDTWEIYTTKNRDDYYHGYSRFYKDFINLSNIFISDKAKEFCIRSIKLLSFI